MFLLRRLLRMRTTNSLPLPNPMHRQLAVLRRWTSLPLQTPSLHTSPQQTREAEREREGGSSSSSTVAVREEKERDRTRLLVFPRLLPPLLPSFLPSLAHSSSASSLFLPFRIIALALFALSLPLLCRRWIALSPASHLNILSLVSTPSVQGSRVRFACMAYAFASCLCEGPGIARSWIHHV
jgi:hypothetical protein